MSNNKQCSVEWFYLNLTDDLIGDLPPEKILKIHELKEQAKAMHKEEIIKSMSFAFIDGAKIGAIEYESPYTDWEQYYNETFNNDAKK